MNDRDKIAKTKTSPYPNGKSLEKTKQQNVTKASQNTFKAERPRVKSNVQSGGGGTGVLNVHAAARVLVSSSTVTVQRLAGGTVATTSVFGENGVRLTFDTATSGTPVVVASIDAGTTPPKVDPARDRATTYVDVTNASITGPATRELQITVFD